MKNWYVFQNDRYEGPYSSDEIQFKVEAGSLHPQTPLWTDGMDGWVPLNQTTPFESLTHLFHDLKIDESVGPPLPLPPDKSFDFLDSLVMQDTGFPEEPAEDDPIALPKPIRARAFVPFEPELLTPAERKKVAHLVPVESQALEPFSARKKKALLAAGAGFGLILVIAMLRAQNPYSTPLPNVLDVSREEERELRAALSEPLSHFGATAAIAMTHSDPLTPSFYIATNLKSGTRFQLQIDGKPETLVDRWHVSVHATLTAKNGIAKSPPFRQENGQPFPRGEYEVAIIDSGRVIGKKTYFIGGARDREYDLALKDYHSKLRLRTQGELSEVRQFAETLEGQLIHTTEEFQRLLQSESLAFSSRKHRWESFHSQWADMQAQLDDTIREWTPEKIENELFYGKLYQAIQKANQVVTQVHLAQNAYFGAGRANAATESQIAADISVAQSSLLELKSKIALAQRLPVSSNGMPQRDGL